MKGHGCSPNKVVYSVILDGVCIFGSLEKVLELLAGMETLLHIVCTQIEILA